MRTLYGNNNCYTLSLYKIIVFARVYVVNIVGTRNRVTAAAGYTQLIKRVSLKTGARQPLSSDKK